MNRRLRNDPNAHGVLAEVVSHARDDHRHDGGCWITRDAANRHGCAHITKSTLKRVPKVCALLSVAVAERAEGHVVEPYVYAGVDVVHPAVGVGADGVDAYGLSVSGACKEEKRGDNEASHDAVLSQSGQMLASVSALCGHRYFAPRLTSRQY